MSEKPASTVRQLLDSIGLPDTVVDAPLTAGAGDRLGRYVVTGAVGVGGMGEVLQVRDPDLGREMAAKVIRGEADSLAVRKFVLEAQVTGQLEHPGIVPLHELGVTTDGRLYFTMKRVAGKDLAGVLDRVRRGGRPTLPERLRILVKVCDAVAFAHSRDVIHRDLKPANVLVGEYGEVVVCDWGLAKILGRADAVGAGLAPSAADAAATLDGTVMGTPAYMPPEQARGEIDRLDARSDIYALGAILYEMLALAPPFVGGNAAAVLQQVDEGHLVPPSERGQDVPHALEAIVLRAMARAPRDRYPSVAALKDDLEAFLADQPVSAARYGLRERIGRWVRRHPTLTVAAVLLLILGSAGGGVGLSLQARARRAELEARSAELEALARGGKIAELVAALGGQRRQVRDEALAWFVGRYEQYQRSADALSVGTEAHDRLLGRFAEVLGTDGMARVRRAYEKLFRDHGELGIEITSQDHFYRGLLRAMDRDLAGARADWERALDLDPRNADVRLNLGILRELEGDPDAALATYDALLIDDPDNPKGRLNRGYLRYRRGHLEQALSDLDHLVRLAPGHRQGRLNRGLAREKLGDLDGALADFEAVLVAHPEDADARNNRGYLRQQKGDLTGARADYDRAIASDPRHASARLNRGALRFNAGDVDGARPDFEAAIAAAPDNPRGWSGRASCRAAKGHYTGAVADYDRALALAPRDLHALEGRASAREQAGDVDGAFADFATVLEVAPRHVSTLINRAGAWIRRGRPAEALADTDRALAIDPRHWAAHANRALALHRLGRKPEALAAIDRALATCPPAQRPRMQALRRSFDGR